jgi:hypothetical protein
MTQNPFEVHIIVADEMGADSQFEIADAIARCRAEVGGNNPSQAIHDCITQMYHRGTLKYEGHGKYSWADIKEIVG